MSMRFICILSGCLIALRTLARGGHPGHTGGSSVLMMSDTMARNTMIVIGVAALIVFLYGVKYWKKR
jgi:hypothetical protein